MGIAGCHPEKSPEGRQRRTDTPMANVGWSAAEAENEWLLPGVRSGGHKQAGATSAPGANPRQGSGALLKRRILKGGFLRGRRL